MRNFKISILFLFVWLLPVAAIAQIPERPSPPRLVNDLADILTAEQEQLLEDKLVQFDNVTSTQIAVVTVKSFGGYDRADFAYRIGESWGVGQEGKNNGIVVLVKPKIGNESGQVYIAVGYGLEGIIPDATANRQIVNNEMIPRFMENDYYGGISNGVDVIMKLARGEYTVEKYTENDLGEGIAAIIFLIIFIIVIIVVFRNRRHFDSGSNNGFPPIITGGSNHRGSWGSFSSGSGGFGGGGSSGGFGGFGGGSFGGGGAGGSW